MRERREDEHFNARVVRPLMQFKCSKMDGYSYPFDRVRYKIEIKVKLDVILTYAPYNELRMRLKIFFGVKLNGLNK